MGNDACVNEHVQRYLFRYTGTSIGIVMSKYWRND